MKIERSGELSVFVQEGGFAADGITIGGRDLGEILREATGNETGSVDWPDCKITVELDEGAGQDGGVGFFRQIETARDKRNQ